MTGTTSCKEPRGGRRRERVGGVRKRKGESPDQVVDNCAHHRTDRPTQGRMGKPPHVSQADGECQPGRGTDQRQETAVHRHRIDQFIGALALPAVKSLDRDKRSGGPGHSAGDQSNKGGRAGESTVPTRPATGQAEQTAQ